MNAVKDHIKTILLWSILNLFLNLVGLVIILLLNEDGYNPFTNLLWYLKNIGFQTLIFSIVLFVTYFFIKNQKLHLYSFPLLQLLIFHLIFLIGFEKDDNRFYFISSWDSWEMSYLFSNQQNLIEIISVFNAMEGSFDDTMFVPDLDRFYFVWILLTSIYFFIVTWLTDKILIKLRSLNHKKKVDISTDLFDTLKK